MNKDLAKALDEIRATSEKMRQLPPEVRRRITEESAAIVMAGYVLRNMTLPTDMTEEQVFRFQQLMSRLLAQEERRVLSPLHDLDKLAPEGEES